jgi:hypothetical protein
VKAVFRHNSCLYSEEKYCTKNSGCIHLRYFKITVQTTDEGNKKNGIA